MVDRPLHRRCPSQPAKAWRSALDTSQLEQRCGRASERRMKCHQGEPRRRWENDADAEMVANAVKVNDADPNAAANDVPPAAFLNRILAQFADFVAQIEVA